MNKKQILLMAAAALYSNSSYAQWDGSSVEEGNKSRAQKVKPKEGNVSERRTLNTKKVDKVNLVANLVDDPGTAHHEGSLRVILDKKTNTYKVGVGLNEDGELCVDDDDILYSDECFKPSELEVRVDDLSGGRFGVNSKFFSINETGIPRKWIDDGEYSVQLFLKGRRKVGGKIVGDQLASIKKTNGEPREDVTTTRPPVKSEPYGGEAYHLKLNYGDRSLSRFGGKNPNEERFAYVFTGERLIINTDHPEDTIGEFSSSTDDGDKSLIPTRISKTEVMIEFPRGTGAIYDLEFGIKTKDGKTETEKLKFYVNEPTNTLPKSDGWDLEARINNVKMPINVNETTEPNIYLGNIGDITIGDEIEIRVNNDNEYFNHIEGLYVNNSKNTSRIDPSNLEVEYIKDQNSVIKGVRLKSLKPGKFQLKTKVLGGETEDTHLLEFEAKSEVEEKITNYTVTPREPSIKEFTQPEWSWAGTIFGSYLDVDFDLNSGARSSFGGFSEGVRGSISWAPWMDEFSFPGYAEFVRTDFDVTSSGMSGEADQNSIEVGAGLSYKNKKTRAALTLGVVNKNNNVSFNADNAHFISEESAIGARINGSVRIPQAFDDFVGFESRADIEAVGVEQRNGISFDDYEGSQTETRDLGTRLNIRAQAGVTYDWLGINTRGGLNGYSVDVPVANGIEEGASTVRGMNLYIGAHSELLMDGYRIGGYAQAGILGSYQQTGVEGQLRINDMFCLGVGWLRTTREIAPNRPDAEARAREVDDRLNLRFTAFGEWEDFLMSPLFDRTDDDF